jgi:hypothetical protein
VSHPDDEQVKALVSGLRAVRDDARDTERAPAELPGGVDPLANASEPLTKLQSPDGNAPPGAVSPERDALNELWDLEKVRPTSFFRRLLARGIRFALGPMLERQTEMNGAQVRFDNELVAYVDGRLDGLSQHYDSVLGLHGKRMEEIDERHLILQQELIRHVHDLVQRIEFVFETAESNHLYVDGMSRETREELRELSRRLDAVADIGRDEQG